MGEFTTGSIPVLAGAYFDFQVQSQEPVIVNPNGVAAIPFVHNWGPANQIVTLNSFADFINAYGQGGLPYTPGYIAIREAFDGEGLAGRGGASQILAYRMVGSGGAAGSKILTNTTPATAITLTAKYQGSWSSNVSVSVIPTPSAPTTETDINIWVQGVLVETYTFPKTTLSVAVAAINSGSQWVSATLALDGVALTTVSSPTALTGGNDGSTLISSDWTNMMTAYGSRRFSVFAPFDLTDSAILASVVAWGGQGAGGLNAVGKRCEVVVGGALNETASTAATRAESIDDPNFITIGVGSYSDSLLGTLSTSQLAPRLAGIIAQRGGGQGLTFARLARVSIINGPVYSDTLSGITNGFMTLGVDSNPDAPVRFEKGVTTWSTTTDDLHPVSVFGNPKFVLTMQQIERAVTEWAESNVIGQMPVNDASVKFVINFLAKYLKGLQDTYRIQPGFTVQRATSPSPTPSDDFIALTYQILFGRDVEKVLSTVIVG
jgi:hypothetical protein